MSHKSYSSALKPQRNLNIDLIKIIAMFGVVMLHTTRSYMSEGGWDYASFMYKSAVVAIPLFFMVSGYLLLGRPTISYSYVAKKIWRILRYVAVFVTANWLLLLVIRRGGNVGQLIDSFISSITGTGSFYVFWYFGAMIIIYLILPPINSLYRNNFSFFASLLIILLIIQAFIFSYSQHCGPIKILNPLRQHNWMTYFCLGGIIKQFEFKLKASFLLILILLIVNFVYQNINNQYIDTTLCSFYYASIPIISFAVLVFINCLRINCNKFQGIIKFLSRYFLLVFSVHILFIGFVNNIVSQLPLAALWCWLIVSAVSVFVSWIILKIPYLNKILTI